MCVGLVSSLPALLTHLVLELESPSALLPSLVYTARGQAWTTKPTSHRWTSLGLLRDRPGFSDFPL